MMKFTILDGIYAIDLNEVQAIEFCDSKPITNDGKYRIKILFRGSDIQWFDVSKREFDRFAQKIMENRIC